MCVRDRDRERGDAPGLSRPAAPRTPLEGVYVRERESECVIERERDRGRESVRERDREGASERERGGAPEWQRKCPLP